MDRKGSEGPARLGVHWTLPADLRRRFGAYASFRGEDESALVTDARCGRSWPGFTSATAARRRAPARPLLRPGTSPRRAVPTDRRESA